MQNQWQTVRVFISSTFRDMHAERDHLVKVTFPRLRQWCEQHRLHFVDIDLRWGVTKEQADNGKAIDICLQEIDGSRPFFVCILGNRYGWVPDDSPAGERHGSERLQTVTGKSITHIEIIHAIDSPFPRIGGSARESCAHAFFYFRKPECLPPPESLTALTPSQRTAYESAFFEEIPDRARMLSEIKESIRQRYRGQERVYEYEGVWDPGVDNPEDAELRGRLFGLEAFGNRVECDLKRAIEMQFAQRVEVPTEADAFEEELALHEAFIEKRTRMHVPRTNVEQKITEYVAGDDLRPLVISGTPGSGKSAILAHWAKERSDGGTMSLAGECLVVRFVGASPSSTSLGSLLGGVCEQLWRRFHLMEVVEEPLGDGPCEIGKGCHTRLVTRPIAVPEDPREVENKWPRFLEAAGTRAKVVVILDAVDQLGGSTDPHSVYWIPPELPPGIRLIVSVTDHGKAPESTDSTPPVLQAMHLRSSMEWLVELRRRGLPEVCVAHLSEEECVRIIREVPSVFCKILDEDQVRLLLENSATRNPLFLTVALEELRIFGSFERLPQAIAGLPRTDDPGDTGAVETTLDRLFGQVLDRLDCETSRLVPGLVGKLFSYLACSRDGLSEQHLAGLLAESMPDVAPATREGQTQLVLRQMRPHLERTQAQGTVLIDFYHKSFRRAAIAKYYKTDHTMVRTHEEIASYFENLPWFAESPEEQRARARRRPPTPRPANVRKVMELPWQRLQAAILSGGDAAQPKQWDSIARLLTCWQFLEAKAESGQVIELARDISEALAAMPRDHKKNRILRLLGKAIGRDIHFIACHPTTFFQCMWNTCWWYDCPDAARHYLSWVDRSVSVLGRSFGFSGHGEHYMRTRWPTSQSGLSGARDEDPAARLSNLVEEWRAGKEDVTPGFTWVRSLRPPAIDLGSGQTIILRGHESCVSSIAYSPDGRRIATGSDDHTVRVWDAVTGNELRCLRGHESCVSSIAYSPDSRRIASGSDDRTVRLWDVETGTELRSLRGYESRVSSVAYSPDGRQIVGGAPDKTVRLWDAETGDELHCLRVPPNTSWTTSLKARLGIGSRKTSLRGSSDIWTKNNDLESLRSSDFRPCRTQIAIESRLGHPHDATYILHRMHPIDIELHCEFPSLRVKSLGSA